jgi:hypothetical protein
MKKTLLEIVQSIASDMESDEINDIDESTESLQLVNIIEQTYYKLIVTLGLPEHMGPYELEAVGGPTKPTKMNLPSSVVDSQWVKYDNRLSGEPYPKFQLMEWVPLDEFMSRMYTLPEEADTNIGSFTETINGSSIEFFYKKDRGPSYYSSYNDNVLLFDSVDLAKETNLQKTNTLCWGRLVPVFERTNNFIPSLDAEKFPMFIDKAKSLAFNDLKQIENKFAIQDARAGMIDAEIQKTNVRGKLPYGHKNHWTPNYGRN